MSNIKLQNAVAPVQWSCDSAQGKADNLSWVDSEIYEQSTSFRAKQEHAKIVYRHRPYGAYLPRTMKRASMEAQQRGEPTVLEGILLLFAKMEWLVATRKYYWSPMSPVPKLLANLVESMGIDMELHRNRPEVLSRLVARIPTWTPSRGTVQGAKDLLVETIGEVVPLRTAQVPKDKSIPMDPDIKKEVFICHDADWWERRLALQPRTEDKSQTGLANMKISSGFLQFQNVNDPMPLHHEDVLVGWKLSDKFPTNLLRLLPSWISIRVVILPDEKK